VAEHGRRRTRSTSRPHEPGERGPKDRDRRREAARIPELKAKGCFTEIIAYKTRVFVPTDKAEAILQALTGPATTPA
jgi:hypothetical protein